MIIQAVEKITQKQDLTLEEAGQLIEYLSTNEANPLHIAAFLAAIKTKGECVDEITGFAMKMREKALHINTTGIKNIVDSCGTGGDKSNTFNISTACAIIAAAGGIPVAKHSNFGFTSKSGSSNVVEALGIKLSKTPEEAENSLRKNSIAFIHAPYFHKCTLHVNQVRKELGIRTIFNYLGPLTNPCSPQGQVTGVSNPEMLPKITETLKNLGCKRAVVVCGIDPLIDEISISGKTLVSKLEKGKIKNFEIKPEDFGILRVDLQKIKGDTPEYNAQIIEKIFTREITGPKLEAVLLNSAALFWAADMVPDMSRGIKASLEVINSGKALKKLQDLRNG
jgi:anthranilate phosphoribosyltransferase